MELIKRLKHAVGSSVRWATKSIYQTSVEPSNAVTIFARSFDRKSKHFIIEFLRQHNDFGKTSVSLRTPVFNFHKNFCPATTGEALGLRLENDLPLFVYPWGVFGTGAMSTEKKVLVSRFCGPSTSEFIHQEEERIVSLKDLLVRDGYAPSRYPNSYIQGVWLVSKSHDRRFVVLQGNHRMAILSYLGYSKVEVRSDMFNVRKVCEVDAKTWPLVKAGIISEDEAIKIFRAFF